jgi:hypothetical protein
VRPPFKARLECDPRSKSFDGVFKVLFPTSLRISRLHRRLRAIVLIRARIKRRSIWSGSRLPSFGGIRHNREQANWRRLVPGAGLQ